MGPLKRLIGSLIFFLYIGEETKAWGEERLWKPPQSFRKPPKDFPKTPPTCPKAPPSLPKPPQSLPQSLPESPKASQASAKPPQSRPKATLAPNGISLGQILTEWHLNQTCQNKNRAGMQTRASNFFVKSNRQQKSPLVFPIWWFFQLFALCTFRRIWLFREKETLSSPAWRESASQFACVTRTYWLKHCK